MHISAMHWSQVEARIKVDDRAIVPLGSTEQHAGLSLSVDSILSERVATEAAEPLGIPVFPVVPYGITPYFKAFPGSISLRVETYVALVRDILDGLYGQGFRRILLVNGHGGNQPAGSFAIEWMADHPDSSVKFHNWWNAPKTFAKVQAVDHGGEPRLLDGEFCLDAARRRRSAEPAASRWSISTACAPSPPEACAQAARRRQFRRILRKAGCRHAGDLGGRGRRRRVRSSKDRGRERHRF